MAGHYERVNAHDDEEPESPVASATRGRNQPTPNSPPPSFHSRDSSANQRGRVDPTLADAFDDDDASDDDADDRQLLTRRDAAPQTPESSGAIQLPTEPAQPQASSARASAAATRGHVMGGGVGTDGVFANMSARPERGTASEKDEQPPTYEQAAADSAPPYWETTILAPGLGGPDEVYVDGMPVGSFFSFIWNGMISTSFQFVGFLLTYLLHSTHAAKNGSRAGLGITLIQYGFYMKGVSDSDPPMGGPDGYAAPSDPNSHDFKEGEVTDGGSGSVADISSTEWLGYVLMIVGWFILIKSIAQFMVARRHERLVLQSPDRGLGIPIIATGESSERVV